MATFTVVYDACVFYPAPLRDLLVRLAKTRRFRARWTARIHEEWTRNLLANRPDLTSERLERTVMLINKAVEDCLVAGYEHIIDGLKLPDPDDRHVLAAAIRVGAAAIVTMNLKDFPKEALGEFGVFAIHPDDFILDLADLEPPILERVAKVGMLGIVGMFPPVRVISQNDLHDLLLQSVQSVQSVSPGPSDFAKRWRTVVVPRNRRNEHLGVARQPGVHSWYSQSAPLWITMNRSTWRDE